MGLQTEVLKNELHSSWKIFMFNDPAKHELMLSSRDYLKYGCPEMFCNNIATMDGNAFTVNGKTEMVGRLMTGDSAGIFFRNDLAYLGVGLSVVANSTDANGEVSDTDLVDAGAIWRPMDVTFPKENTVNSLYFGTIWQSTWEDGVAEFLWREFGLANGSDPGAAMGILFNRIQTTPTGGASAKAPGDIWILQLLVQ